MQVEPYTYDKILNGDNYDGGLDQLLDDTTRKKIIETWKNDKALIIFPISAPTITSNSSKKRIYSILEIRRNNSKNKSIWMHFDNDAVKEPPFMRRFLMQLNLLFITIKSDATKSYLIPIIPDNTIDIEQLDHEVMDHMTLCIETFNHMLKWMNPRRPEIHHNELMNIQWSPLKIHKSLLQYETTNIKIMNQLMTDIPDIISKSLYIVKPQYASKNTNHLRIYTKKYNLDINLYSDPLYQSNEDMIIDGEKELHTIYLGWKEGQYPYDIHHIVERFNDIIQQIPNISVNKLIRHFKQMSQQCDGTWKLNLFKNRMNKISMSRIWAIRAATDVYIKAGKPLDDNIITIAQETLMAITETDNIVDLLMLLSDKDKDMEIASRIKEVMEEKDKIDQIENLEK